jgi:hypothetical protein
MHRIYRLTLAARMAIYDVGRPLLQPDMSERKTSLDRSELADGLI